VDRDANASYNVLSRGLQELGLRQAEVTPVETATAVGTDGAGSSSVPASRAGELPHPVRPDGLAEGGASCFYDALF
jgi:hypothetical protein